MDSRTETQRLRLQLQQFISQAEENATKAQRFQNLELKLIGSSSLSQLINSVVDEYQCAFDLDVITLALLDPEYEIRRMLDNGQSHVCSMHRLIFLTCKKDLQLLSGLSLIPQLGAFNRKKHKGLFADVVPSPCSIAILPLVGHGRVMGSLNLGSRNPDRFKQNLGADFLERLAAIASMCFENTLNYERLKMLGMTDPLTGVSNRRFFEQRLREEVIRTERSAEPLSCLFFDIDRFKRVNDQFGHLFGDFVIREVASILSAQMRLSDILVRYGGEEFAALLVNTHREDAIDIAERIRQAIADHPLRTPQGESLQITISIGVAAWSHLDHGLKLDSGQRLVHSADMALLDAKEAGRNRVVASHLILPSVHNKCHSSVV